MSAPIAIASSNPGIERSPSTARWTARLVIEAADGRVVERVELGAEVVTEDQAVAAFYRLQTEREGQGLKMWTPPPDESDEPG